MRNLRPAAIVAAIVAALLLVCASAPSASKPHAQAVQTLNLSPKLTSGVTSGIEPRPRASAVKVVSTASAPPPAVVVRVPTPPSTPPGPTGDGYHGSVAALIRSVFGSASGTALCIAWRESRFDPYARNPHSSASGVFQLMRIWWQGRWSFDPFNAWQNVYHAHLMFQMYGWGPWGGGC